ncbi:signal peptidase II Aspartic peptidase. MEROPS family A08 [Desulfocicer vacuolatum DSM 3385]|uniref:Lipoprotein signal peptidase n=1 Tax=Desulfocicer vacuolatum DSM 3385 TaxID=1121400 RepID=A0A1W1Z7D5_9BACT|nr:signal peptidase II [Desulfocicer vacuolatum]SMC44359.1 signal peptidase II Aspartic peptidase. MEROPS family A08 [Desulfocicer vacuolatum DSM 3385]
MTVTGKQSLVRLVTIAGGVILADQLTKALIMAQLPLYERMEVTSFFNITHVLNPGGAFGMFATQSPVVRRFFFLFVSSLVSLGLLWFYGQVAREHRFLSMGLAAIFGGAVGNLIDRFRFGQVVDFLDFYIGTWHWPAFNVADSAICIGMAILFYHVILNKIPEL